MKIKHKLLADYQYVSEDKKIFLIKSGSILEDYVHSLKGEKIKIDRELVENNPDLFQLIDFQLVDSFFIVIHLYILFINQI